MKLKFTPRWQHVVLFLVASAALALQYLTDTLKNASPMTITGFWAVYGTAIITQFQHNVMQPDDVDRNPGLLKKSIRPPAMPMSDSGEDTRMQLHILVTAVAVIGIIFVCACAAIKPAVNAVIDLADAECAADAVQPNESSVEQLVCEVVDVTGKVIQLFTVQVAKDDAPAFLTRHSIKSGHPNPLTVKAPQ